MVPTACLPLTKADLSILLSNVQPASNSDQGKVHRMAPSLKEVSKSFNRRLMTLDPAILKGAVLIFTIIGIYSDTGSSFLPTESQTTPTT